MSSTIPKYRNKKTTVGNLTFDSAKEARVYKELLLRQQAGDIFDLRIQVKYELIPAQYATGTRLGKPVKKCIERACTYIADFVFTHNGILEVWDAKGLRTKDYIIKRKLLLERYGIAIREV